MMTKAAEMLPDYGPVRYRFGMAYLKLGRNDLAVQKLRQSASLLDLETSPYTSRITKTFGQVRPGGQHD
jgi:hypothetical protein